MEHVMSATSICTNEILGEISDWLSRHIQVDEVRLVSDHPWAKTYRVRSGSDVYYLKSLPAGQRAALEAMPVLAAHFSTHVPEVVAYDAAVGLLLLRDHEGTAASNEEPTRVSLLRMYASMQASARHIPELLRQLPAANLTDVCERFQEFLNPDFVGSERVGAVHFLDRERAHHYCDRISLRAPLLRQLILQAIHLPQTINHGDLRLQNVATRSDGSLVIFDWDEATAGPAGMSLHNFFSGCSVPARLLGCKNEPSPVSERQRDLLKQYIDTLIEFGYSSRDSLEQALPGSICAGVMEYLLSYGKFPMADAGDREQVAKIMVRRLDDLLTLCDELALASRETVVRCLDDYEEADCPERARYLLDRFLSTSSPDAELQLRLGQVLNYLGDSDAALRTCQQALEADPQHAELRCLFGRLLVERLQLDEAVDQFRLAAAFDPQNEEFRRRLEDAALMQEMERHAARSGCVPTVRFTAEEIRLGLISRAKRRLAARMFRDYGTLIVENVFEAELMDRLLTEFSERYRSYLADDRPDDALRVGNKRFMITVDVDGRFNDPALYAAPLLTPILARLLGDEFVLGSFTSVASLPGASEMRMHKDHPALFDEGELANTLPTVAVTTLIPLRGFDLVMGTTRVVKGSHRRSSEESAEMEWQDPCAPKGSCLLMDYRLSHQGLANRSQVVRPVLSVVYNRPWFRDSVNYELQAPLRITRAEFARVPQAWQRLFAWTRP
jgi:ectoine hydroxylase-related dioxygenase (phytanoyl-CoA dioxygenase family)